MNIMWVGNILLPQIADTEGKKHPVVGGWMVYLSELIALSGNINLIYLFDHKERMDGITNNGINYYSLQPDTKSPKRLGEKYITQALDIISKEQPDVIHIWGTEQPHALAIVEACSRLGIEDRVVISIQGMLSEYAKYFTAFLPLNVIYGAYPKDIIKGNISRQKAEFEIKGQYEVEALSRVKHIIGRTDWDRACTWKINSEAEYHFNNEILRKEFYSDEWRLESCEKYTVFCSQAHYPIKGLHLLLQALKILKKKYPLIKLYVGGKDFSTISRMKLSAYQNYLLKYIETNELQDNVVFCGLMTAEEMKKRYLKSHVFVSPSSIENSPNSVGEAMLLGCPVISSRVGGVHNMLKHGEEGLLYAANDISTLAYYINIIFSDNNLARMYGKHAKLHAMDTHSIDKNFKQLVQIYLEIAKGI